MAPAKDLLSTTKELLIRFTLWEAIFVCFIFFFSSFPFREAKLPYFLFFFFFVFSHFFFFFFSLTPFLLS